MDNKLIKFCLIIYLSPNDSYLEASFVIKYINSVWASFVSSLHKLWSYEKWGPELRICLHKTQLEGIFLTSNA